LPVYWKAIEHVPAQEILGHRVVWSLAVALGVLALRRQWGWLREVSRRPAILLPFVGTAVLLTVNWLIYIWANNTGHIVETSLGYFINPLVNVLLGVLLLSERMRAWQWAAVGLASVGVAYLTFSYGRLPWIALILASTFGLYGLIRKTAALESTQGLAVEMALMFLPALGYLAYLGTRRAGSFGRAGVGVPTTALLGLAGIVTAIPLILFAYGARRVPLTRLGVLQYAAPTLQFLVGVILYDEGFPKARLIGFGIIWAALLVYSIEGTIHQHRVVAAPRLDARSPIRRSSVGS